MPTPPPKSLETRVAEAVAAAVAALTPRVPRSQVYVRAAGIFVPDRDKLPSLLVCSTPGQGPSLRRLLRPRRAEVTCFATVILADAQNANLKASKAADTDTDWRVAWRVAVVAAVAGHRLGAVPEVVRVFADAGEALDMSQFESSNLWWSAVTFRAVCRVDTP